MSKDLRSYLKSLEHIPGEIMKIKEEVDPIYEITGLVVELEKRKQYPVLYFEQVKGYEIPVVTNVLATRQRAASALDTTSDKLSDTILEREKKLLKPKHVSSGPVKDVILKGDDVNLYSLPILTHFEQDVGPYITAGNMVAKNPDNRNRDLSFKRLQLKGRDKLGTSFHSRRYMWHFQKSAEEQGKPLEIAIIIGVHPTLFLSSQWRGSMSIDDYEVAGGLMNEPLEIVKCETVDLEVPANAEIVLEGEVLPKVREKEGPFGESSGYASDASTNHVVKIKAITHRKNPIYQDITPGFQAEHKLIPVVITEPHLREFLLQKVPTVKAVSYTESAPSRYHCYISMKKMFDGQPRQAIFAALAWDKRTKLVVVVDDDIDVYNEREVLWAIATRMQPDEDVFIIPKGQGNLLDPSSYIRGGISGKMGIDATKPLKGWPAKRLTIPKEVSNNIIGRFKL